MKEIKAPPGQQTYSTNPLEAYDTALRVLMTIAYSAEDDDIKLRACEMLLESSLPLPGDYD